MATQEVDNLSDILNPCLGQSVQRILVTPTKVIIVLDDRTMQFESDDLLFQIATVPKKQVN